MNKATASKRGALREKLREGAREVILHAAEQAFAEHGLEAARIDEIAKRAGCAVGTIYNLFGDRESVVRELLDRRNADMLTALDEALERAERGFASELRAYVGALVEHVHTHAPFFRVVIEGEMSGGLRATAAAAHQCRELVSAVHDRLDRILARGVREKRVRKEVAPIARDFLSGAMRAIVTHDVDRPRGVTSAARVEQILDVFLHGVAVKSSKGAR